MEFKVGEKVIYPNQGVGVIERVCKKNIAGLQQEFYMLKIESSNSTVMIPVANANHVGLRRLCDKGQLDRLFDILENDDCEPNPDWKNRYKDNVEKMKTGSIFEVARVLKNLFFLSFQKPLSFREKKMFDRAGQLVVSEIATVSDKPYEEVEVLVETILTESYGRLHAEAEAEATESR